MLSTLWGHSAILEVMRDCSHGGRWLGTVLQMSLSQASLSKVSDSSLLPWWPLPGRWLRPVPTDVSGLGLFLQMLMAWPQVLQTSLAWACSLSAHSLVPAPVEVAALGLLRWRWLAQAFPTKDCWFRSDTTDAPDSSLLPQRSLKRSLAQPALSAVLHLCRLHS